MCYQESGRTCRRASPPPAGRAKAAACKGQHCSAALPSATQHGELPHKVLYLWTSYLPSYLRVFLGSYHWLFFNKIFCVFSTCSLAQHRSRMRQPIFTSHYQKPNLPSNVLPRARTSPSAAHLKGLVPLAFESTHSSHLHYHDLYKINRKTKTNNTTIVFYCSH